MLSASEIVKESWELYKKSWKKIWVYLVLLLIPTLALSALSTISLYLSVYIPSSTLASSVIILLVIAASIVFTLWASIALARTMGAIYKNEQASDWRLAFSNSSHLILPVIWTSILVALIVLGGTILLIIPGIIFSIWYSFTFYTVIFEDKRGFNALSSSKALVVGRWWRIFWRLFVPGIIFGLAAALISYLIVTLVYLVPMTDLGNTVIERVLNALVNIAITPLTAGATLVLYFTAKENPNVQSSTEPPAKR